MNLKIKKRSIFAFFLVISIFFSFQILPVQSNIAQKENSLKFADYTPSAPLIITNDDNFTDYSLPGDGSELDPFRIENLNITTSDDFAISINYTTKYFVIQNCYINPTLTGIKIDHIAYETAEIVGNYFEKIDDANGIYIEISYSEAIFITNNKFGQSGIISISPVAIKLNYAHQTVVYNNTVNDQVSRRHLTFCYASYSNGLIVTNNTGSQLFQGIHADNSEEVVIANNTISDICSAIHLRWSPFSVIDQNIISNCETFAAIDVYDSYANISNNYMDSGGIEFYENDYNLYHKYNISNNMIEDKQYGFFIDTPDLLLSDWLYGQLFLFNCSNAVITEQHITNALFAIKCHNCTNLQIYNIETDYTSQSIFLRFCDFANITSNSLYITTDLFIAGSHIGLSESHNALIYNNKLLSKYSNLATGLHIYKSNKTEIKYNLFQILRAGVYISSSSYNNTIHHNTFYDSPCEDNGANNTWYDPITLQGNYYSDYSGSGPYDIPGTAGAQDLYPLTETPVDIISEYTSQFKVYTLLTLILSLVLIPILKKRRN